MFERLAFAVSLMFCTGDFREQYGDQLRAQFEAGAPLASAWNIAMTGMLMRFDSFGHDLRTAVRSLARARLIMTVAVIAMGLAIAANFIVAALVQGFFLRPLPFEQPQQLLFVQETDLGRAISYPDAQRYALAIGVYADLALSAQQRVVLHGLGRPALVSGATVSPNYFDVLGVRPALGHFFTTGPGAGAGVVLSHEFWQAHYQGRIDALGKIANLGRGSYQIIGIAPAGFHDPTPYGYVNRDYWLTIDPSDPQATSSLNYNAIARVHAGYDARSLTGDMRDRLSAIVKQRASLDRSNCCVAVSSMADKLSGDVRPLLVLLYAFVSIIVIIAFVNVANLNIARNTTRSGDISVRVALGASPGRIATQLTIEAFVQAVLGTCLGVGIAFMALHYLSVVASPYLPQMSDLGLSPTLVLYACGIVALATFITGVLPGIAGSGKKVTESLKSVGRADDGRNTKKTLSKLVVAEVALATALVVTAGLILHSVIATTRVPLGFDPDNLYLATVTLPDDGSVTPQMQSRYVDQTLETLSQTLGANNVAASLVVPLNCCSTTSMTLERGSEAVSILYNVVTANYFSALRIPVLVGRAFRDSDNLRAPCAAVVDETFALRYFASGNAIGQTLDPDVFTTTQQCTIVGVVRAVPQAYGQAQAPMLYLSMGQVPGFAQFVVRVGNDASAQILRATSQADPRIPTPIVTSYATLMQRQLAVPWISATIFVVLSLLALVLATTGTYALMAYAVARQTVEFGVRIAVGAAPTDILRQVLRSAVSRGGVGVLIGVVLAALLSLPLKSLLYGTAQGEPLVYLGVVSLVLGSTVIAALLPALRAARVEPAIALRQE